MPNIGPAPARRSISASARPPVIAPDGRFCSLWAMVSSLRIEGAAQSVDKFARADAFAEAKRRRAAIDPADNPILVGRARITDASARRRDCRRRDATRVERGQA